MRSPIKYSINDNWRLSHRPPIDLYLVNARGGQVPCDPSKGGVKLLRIIWIRKTTPEGDAVLCR